MRSTPCKDVNFEARSLKAGRLHSKQSYPLAAGRKTQLDQMHFIGAAVNWKRNQEGENVS